MKREPSVIEELLGDTMRIDARETMKALQTPTFLRLRAEDAPDAHPLLAMRSDNMDRQRDAMRIMALYIVEGEPALDTEEQNKAFLHRITRAAESCLRVLACSDAEASKKDVIRCATSMSKSMSVTATILAAQNNPLAAIVQRQANSLEQLVSSVDQVAKDYREVYEQARDSLRADPVDILDEKTNNMMMN